MINTKKLGLVLLVSALFISTASVALGQVAGNSYLTITKRVINLSSGNLIWSTSVSAKPADLLGFSITLQAGNQDVHNIVVRDVLPASLVDKGVLTVNNSTYAGNIVAGLNIGTINAGQSVVIIYQAQVLPASSFPFGITTLQNNATVTSTEAGVQNSMASVIVNKSLVYGASTVATGLTNNFLTDSFLLPLFIIIAGLWLYFSKKIYTFTEKLRIILKK